jgi:hypothetical protein
MKKTELKSIPVEIIAELQAAAEQADGDARDLEEMRKAWERMDRLREENRKLFGDQSIGVDLIREMRTADELRHRFHGCIQMSRLLEHPRQFG